MKKTITLFFCLLAMFLWGTTASAQVFEDEKSIVSAGYGFGTYNPSFWIEGYGFTNSITGPLYAKLEYGISDYAGIGLSFAYVKFIQEGNSGIYHTRDESISYSGLIRINWHFAGNSKFDSYWGIGIGYRSSKWVHSSSPSYDTDFVEIGSPFGFETTLGVRFLVASNFGVYVEGGFAKSAAQIGLFVKL